MSGPDGTPLVGVRRRAAFWGSLEGVARCPMHATPQPLQPPQAAILPAHPALLRPRSSHRVLATARPAVGTSPQTGPSTSLMGRMRARPAGISRARLPSPIRMRFRSRWVCSVDRLTSVWSSRPPRAPVWGDQRTDARVGGLAARAAGLECMAMPCHAMPCTAMPCTLR